MSEFGLLILSILVCSTLGAPKIKFIVGGQDADVNEYPWLVIIKYEIFFLCAGSILDEHNILTSAHCLIHDPEQSYGKFSVVAGEHNITESDGTEQQRLVERVVIHEDFTMGDQASGSPHDIAILHLAQPLDTHGSAVKPIRGLSNKQFDNSSRYTPERCVTAGFGISDDGTRRFPTVLQELSNVHIITNKECNELLSDEGLTVQGGMVCTHDPGRGVCFGDNGGAMGCYNGKGRFIQVGVMSWGPTRMCSHGRGVFTRVSGYRKWVKNHLLI